MLAMLTTTPQPSTQEEALEGLASTQVVSDLARTLPTAIHPDGTISFKDEDLPNISRAVRKAGYFIRTIDTTQSGSGFCSKVIA